MIDFNIRDRQMAFKKSLLSTLLASLTLVSVVACNSQAPVVSVDSQTPSVDAGLTEIYAVAPELKKYKLNFNIKKAEKNTLIAGKKNDLSTRAVDLRRYASPIADQGQLGACTAFAIVKGAREFNMNKAGQAYTALSPLFFYYKEREADGNITEDAGSTITTGSRVLSTVGVSSEAAWPYDITQFAVSPSSAALAEAGKFKSAGSNRLSGLDAVKVAIDKGHPVAFGVRVYESFMKSKGGVIPMPNTATEKLLGGHALAILGYDDAKQTVTVRNSWSAKWGDNGYCYIPYGYFAKGLAMDAWEIL